MRVGLDIGSTTIKCAVLDEHDALIYSTYERHYSHILEKAQELLRRIDAEQLHGQKALLSISGSAGMGLADSCGVPFVQEVFSTRVAVKRFVPATDCVIELGGEDAKILFLTNGTEAVSYTHLDVYKRQPRAWAKVCKKLPQPEEQASFRKMLLMSPSSIWKHFISWPPMSMMKSTSGMKYLAAVKLSLIHS